MRKWPVHIIKEVPKVWGTEFWMVNNDKYCMKYLYIEPGGCCSLHLHPIKDETFVVDEGVCCLQIGDIVHPMYPGDCQRISPGVPHRFWVNKFEADGCMIIEVSTPHSDDDVVRLEESKRL